MSYLLFNLEILALIGIWFSVETVLDKNVYLTVDMLKFLTLVSNKKGLDKH